MEKVVAAIYVRKCSMFYSRSFIVSSFIFNSLIHFQLILFSLFFELNLTQILLWAGIPLKNGVAIIANKRVQNAVLGCNLKNYRMVLVRFKGKPLNTRVIQIYVPNANAKKVEVKLNGSMKTSKTF